jgi:OOP family OmpA-OmpF porin
VYDLRVIRWSGLAVIASLSIAHAEPHLEASAFTGIESFGDSGLGNSFAADQVPGTSALLGARLAYFPYSPSLAAPLEAEENELELGFEAELAVAPASTSGDATHQRSSYFAPVFAWRAHLMLRLSGNAIRPFVVAGAGGETITSTSPFLDKETDPVIYWGPGIALPIADDWQLRFDLRQGFMPGRDGWTTTYELHLGVATTFGLAHHKAPKHVETPPPPPPPVAHDEDSDGDGIPDRLDKCPHEKETVNGVEDEDGCPEADPDGDGIVGARDKCPNEPEDFDHYQDEDGCPDPDNDGDGIPDVKDACPNEPETFNGFADADGCPDVVPDDLATPLAAVVVKFEAGRARITPAAKKELAAVVAALRKYGDVKVAIAGHPAKAKETDLARRRAEGVKWYLVDQGVLADRITTKVGDVGERAIDLTLATP